MKVVFFKRPTHKQFEYKPRYYDEEKELQEKRRQAIENAGSGDSTLMREEMGRRWRRIDNKNRSKAKGINLLIYGIVAALLIYFVFFV